MPGFDCFKHRTGGFEGVKLRCPFGASGLCAGQNRLFRRWIEQAVREIKKEKTLRADEAIFYFLAALIL